MTRKTDQGGRKRGYGIVVTPTTLGALDRSRVRGTRHTETVLEDEADDALTRAPGNRLHVHETRLTGTVTSSNFSTGNEVGVASARSTRYPMRINGTRLANIVSNSNVSRRNEVIVARACAADHPMRVHGTLATRAVCCANETGVTYARPTGHRVRVRMAQTAAGRSYWRRIPRRTADAWSVARHVLVCAHGTARATRPREACCAKTMRTAISGRSTIPARLAERRMGRHDTV